MSVLPKFTDVTMNTGLEKQAALGRSASWADFNSDGFQDLAISNVDIYRKATNFFLFENSKDGIFGNLEIPSEMEKQRIASISWADFDNDGLIDLAAGTIRAGQPPLLYQNKGGNEFYEISSESGFRAQRSSLKNTIWSDYNGDGNIDLFQVNNGVSLLYKNIGDKMFSEVSKESGLGEFLGSNTAVWFDYNNDGYLDLFLGNDEIRALSAKGTNKLYMNKGNGTFDDVSDNSGLKGSDSWDTVSSCTGDFNNDGFIDIYIGNISSDRNALYRNNGDGTFDDITNETDTGDIGDARTCAWIDFNSDGLLDLYTTNHLNPSKLYMNIGDEKFVNVAVEAGIDKPIDVFSAPWADYDNNGTLDVFLNGHLGKALMKNSGNDNNNLIVKLVGNGRTTNTSAIGTRVTINSKKLSQIREVSGGRGCCEQDMLPLHFGMGGEDSADITVTWTDGQVCEFKDFNIKKNTRLQVQQDGCKLKEM